MTNDKPIKQSVLNTFKRLNIPYEKIIGLGDAKVEVANRFTGEKVLTTPLMYFLVNVVYTISNQYEMGINKVNLSDFDRIRYFILEQDPDVYNTCID